MLPQSHSQGALFDAVEAELELLNNDSGVEAELELLNNDSVEQGSSDEASTTPTTLHETDFAVDVQLALANGDIVSINRSELERARAQRIA